MARPSLELHAEVSTASGGRYRWDANGRPANRPRNLSFSTKVGEGFSAGSVQLSRRIDQDYPDLNLLNDVTVLGADGDIAYEGRISAQPRVVDDAHSIGLTLTGWMAHARDKKFSEIYIDRSLDGWGSPTLRRKSSLMVSNYSPVEPSQNTDPTNGLSGVTTPTSGVWVSPFVPLSESWYDAGTDASVGQIAYSWQRRNTNVGTGAPWVWSVNASTDDNMTSFSTSGNLVAAGPGSGTLTPTPGTSFRYAMLNFYYNGTPGGLDAAEYGIDWYRLAVYGTHGLTLSTGEPNEPPGVFASDVIKNIASRWCPRLDTSGVRDTSYVIQHLAFRDRTDPFDAFLEVNKYHLWHLGVWENKRLDFRPYDLRDYDWEVRFDDPGVTAELQGPSVEDLCNGIVVTFTELLTGTQTTLRPDTWTDLRDTSAENPWNLAGVDRWIELTLSTPTLQNQALQIGRMALAERNRPKTPGTISVTGHIRDRGGNWQPAWKVRAGDTIAITNFPNDTPRLIVETDYDDTQKQVRIAVDRPFQLLEAYMDRAGTALQARGLT